MPTKNRVVYHVVHDKAARGWKVEREGSEKAVKGADTKEEAIDAATRLGKAADLGQVIIHREDGSIETEHTYGEDPRRTPG